MFYSTTWVTFCFRQFENENKFLWQSPAGHDDTFQKQFFFWLRRFQCFLWNLFYHFDVQLLLTYTLHVLTSSFFFSNSSVLYFAANSILRLSVIFFSSDKSDGPRPKITFANSFEFSAAPGYCCRISDEFCRIMRWTD